MRTRTGIAGLCPDYDLLGDIVNLSKHKTLTKGPPPKILSLEDVEEQVLFTEYQDAAGAYTHAAKRITLKLVDGSKRDLFEVITNVVNFWLDELHTIGVRKRSPHYALPAQPQHPSRADCAAGFTLEMVRLAFSQAFVLQRFNYATGLIEPIDLTGAKVNFRMYKPSKASELDLTLTHDHSGRSAFRSILISEAESHALNNLETPEQQHDFLAGLPSVQRALGELSQEIRQRDQEERPDV
jgi:hypothetical protein